MPMIPILKFEEVIQTGDKTRLSAVDSFKTPDVAAITAVTIAPGVQSAISVFNTDQSKWFLDWVWDEMKWDIDASMNKIYFTESGSELIATVTPGEYGFDDLLAAIAAAMTAVGGQTYSAGRNLLNEVTISAPTAFKFAVFGKSAALLSILGFTLDPETKAIQFLGDRVDRSRRKVVLTLDLAVSAPVSKTYYVQVLTPETDFLFSTDQDLIAEEADVMKYPPKGRASFLNVHRKAQQHIVDWLDRNGYRDESGAKLTKWHLPDRGQVRLWSSYMALKFIFQGVQNAVDDVFSEKAKTYEGLEIVSRNRAVLELGLNKASRDAGKTDKEISPSSWSGGVVRR